MIKTLISGILFTFLLAFILFSIFPTNSAYASIGGSISVGNVVTSQNVICLGSNPKLNSTSVYENVNVSNTLIIYTDSNVINTAYLGNSISNITEVLNLTGTNSNRQSHTMLIPYNGFFKYVYTPGTNIFHCEWLAGISTVPKNGTIDTGVFAGLIILIGVFAYFAIHATETQDKLPTFEKLAFKYMTLFMLLVLFSLALYDLSVAGLIYNAVQGGLWIIGITILLQFIYDIMSLFLIPIGFFKKFSR